MIEKVFKNQKNKNLLGTANELLISGNLANKGYQTKVLNDRNPNYDISITKDNQTNYIECKLDLYPSNNFYFEYWNFTYNRPTGINNENKETLYSHTFKRNGKYFAIIAKRKIFIDVLKQILKHHPEKIRRYNNTYYVNGSLKGDRAYIVDKDIFLKYFNGAIIELQPQFKW